MNTLVHYSMSVPMILPNRYSHMYVCDYENVTLVL